MPRSTLTSEPEPHAPLHHERRIEDELSISGRVRADLAAVEAPVDLADAAKLAQRVLTRRGMGESTDPFLWERNLLARAVLAQSALLDRCEGLMAEGPRR